MAREDVLIHVDNRQGRDNHDGIHQPVATADRAFTLLPPYWQGRAEIIFEPTGEAYPVSTSAMCFGTPMGPEASPLVIRGGYTDELGAITASGGTGDNVEVITSRSVGVDDLIGAVLTRQTRLSPAGSPVGTAISIRGNTEGTNPTISLQRSMGLITPGETFVVQRPAVTLVPNPPHPPDPPRPGQALNLTSDDGGSLNLTLIGIRIAPTRGKALNLLNVRAQCDTCEFSFQKDPNPDIDPITFFVHTNARIQGGIANADLSQELDPSRADAGVYIYSDNASNAVWAVREGVLAGHLTFARITVRVSQGGAFVPKSLEALEAPINILAGGAAVAEPQKEGRLVVGSWGTASNKARIRNIAGDGLRAFNGGSINSPLAPIHLDIHGCSRDGIRLDMASTACFGPPGGLTGLVTTGRPNGGFGLNVRNASCALIGSDTALNGRSGQVALDDQLIRDPATSRDGWAAVDPSHPRSNLGLSLVRRNI